MRLEGFIKEFYPEWYGIQEYPANKTAAFCKVAKEWGVLGNFAPTPIVVDGVPFDCAEKLFQVMKFADEESRKIIYAQKGQPIKMMARHQEKVGVVRDDWGRIFIDGLFIVEQQVNPRRPAGAYSAKLSEDGQTWVGPNILGRLLMELRDKGSLSYNLPEDSMHFPDLI